MSPYSWLVSWKGWYLMTYYCLFHSTQKSCCLDHNPNEKPTILHHMIHDQTSSLTHSWWNQINQTYVQRKGCHIKHMRNYNLVCAHCHNPHPGIITNYTIEWWRYVTWTTYLYLEFGISFSKDPFFRLPSWIGIDSRNPTKLAKPSPFGHWSLVPSLSIPRWKHKLLSWYKFIGPPKSRKRICK